MPLLRVLCATCVLRAAPSTERAAACFPAFPGCEPSDVGAGNPTAATGLAPVSGGGGMPNTLPGWTEVVSTAVHVAPPAGAEVSAAGVGPRLKKTGVAVSVEVVALAQCSGGQRWPLSSSVWLAAAELRPEAFVRAMEWVRRCRERVWGALMLSDALGSASGRSSVTRSTPVLTGGVRVQQH